MHSSADSILLLVVLAFIIFASPYFSKIFRIPIAAVEIILGSIAGYFGLVIHNDIFTLVSEVGLFFLMFLAGMEIDLRIVFNADRDILKKGGYYFAILYTLSIALTFLLDLNRLFILIVPMMSVGMIFTLFKEYGKEKEWLNLSMLIGSIGEVVSIILFTFTVAYLEFGASAHFWISIFYLCAFLVISILGFRLLEILFWWYPWLKMVLMPHHDKNEKDIRLSVALFFVVIAIMAILDLEVAFGSFIAGMFIATFFDHKQDLPHKLGSFGFGFLVPIFFVHIGSSFKIENLSNIPVVTNALFIVITMALCRFISSFVFVRVLSIKELALYALSHSMPLTLLVAAATIAHKSHAISDANYAAFILASILQTIISMVGIKFLYNFGKKST